MIWSESLSQSASKEILGSTIPLEIEGNYDNWSVNDNGKVVGIYIPAIYEDRDISFKYR